MMLSPELFDRLDLRRPECRDHVIALIRGAAISDGRKRAIYLRWLLDVGLPYDAIDLQHVIDLRPAAAPEQRR